MFKQVKFFVFASLTFKNIIAPKTYKIINFHHHNKLFGLTLNLSTKSTPISPPACPHTTPSNPRPLKPPFPPLLTHSHNLLKTLQLHKQPTSFTKHNHSQPSHPFPITHLPHLPTPLFNPSLPHPPNHLLDLS